MCGSEIRIRRIYSELHVCVWVGVGVGVGVGVCVVSG